MQKQRALPNGTRIQRAILLFLLIVGLSFDADPAVARSNKSEEPCIDAIGLCTIVDGRKHEMIIGRDKLAPNVPLSTEGYISEIKLYCAHQDISAGIVDETSNLDRLKVTKGSTWNPTTEADASRTQVSIVPKIPGDCIGLDDEVTIAVSNPQGAAKDITIRQTGYRTVYQAPTDNVTRTQPIVFRYLGNEADRFQSAAGRERFEALKDGIRKIERAYGQELVHTVNIIDLKGSNNALSLKGKNEFWIYADTFWGYDRGELRSMAAHESLHIFVDDYGFTEEPAIRQLFADLMGFDRSSKERQTLLKTGHLPRGYSSRHKPLSPFWGFINERHFIDGMSGGHASDNIDEFCTSFLHSLLYTDRLEENLNKAIASAPRKPPRVMNAEERERLLQLYRTAVEVFASTVAELEKDDNPPIIRLCATALHCVNSVHPAFQ